LSERDLPTSRGAASSQRSTADDPARFLTGMNAALHSQRDRGAPTDLAGLRGARFVTVVETEDGARWAEAKIKALTGGDNIAARFMRGDFFQFRPEFKLVIAGNHKPGLRSVEEAMRRRLHLVPFTVTIPMNTSKRSTEYGAQWFVMSTIAGKLKARGMIQRHAHLGRQDARISPNAHSKTMCGHLVELFKSTTAGAHTSPESCH